MAGNDRNFPYDVLPSGWFQVLWSDELKAGDTVPLQYFDTQLVAYRGMDGVARVLDAYCPHLGAHLGHGGRVCGTEIECPFHGWRWNAEGRNTEIPYSTRVNRSLRLGVWEVREVNGGLFVWYDAEGAPPTWEPPRVAEGDSADYWRPYPEFTKLWAGRRLMPQLVAENAVDPAHQKYVHGAAEVPPLETFEIEGPMFHSRFRIQWGKGKDQTWMTPSGEVSACLDGQAWGMGIAVARFEGTDGAVHLQCQTPIDRDHSDLRVTIFAKKIGDGDRPGESEVARLRHQLRQVDNDLVIWENMRYTTRPPFPPEEHRAYMEFRKWAAQFYRSASLSNA